MELFQKAVKVRLVSHHDKYLIAEDDEESVCLDHNGSSMNANWTVEIVEGDEKFLRFKSCYSKYLTASNLPFLPGVTGRKILQTIPERKDSSIEWEPVRDGFQVRLLTRYGNYLRPNGGLPPWRNSVTHDHPHRPGTHDKILWDVQVVERARPKGSSHRRTVTLSDYLDWETNSPSSVFLGSNLSKKENFPLV